MGRAGEPSVHCRQPPCCYRTRFRAARLKRWHDETGRKPAFGLAALDRIEQRVAASKKRHSSEICICVESGLPPRCPWRDATARDRAIAMFGTLRVWDTEANNGLRIYLLLAEHKIEIGADCGLPWYVPLGHWKGIVATMRADFQAGRFEADLMRAIEVVEDLLVQNFAVHQGQVDRNEVPDAPHVD